MKWKPLTTRFDSRQYRQIPLFLKWNDCKELITFYLPLLLQLEKWILKESRQRQYLDGRTTKLSLVLVLVLLATRDLIRGFQLSLPNFSAFFLSQHFKPFLNVGYANAGFDIIYQVFFRKSPLKYSKCCPRSLNSPPLRSKKLKKPSKADTNTWKSWTVVLYFLFFLLSCWYCYFRKWQNE